MKHQAAGELCLFRTIAEGGTPLGGDPFLLPDGEESDCTSMLVFSAYRDNITLLYAQEEKSINTYLTLKLPILETVGSWLSRG